MIYKEKIISHVGLLKALSFSFRYFQGITWYEMNLIYNLKEGLRFIFLLFLFFSVAISVDTTTGKCTLHL